MKIDNLPDIFVDAMPVIKRLKEAGFEAYFVGGAVRDLLLKRKIHDIDIATSAYPQEVKQIFAKVIDTGIKHGTVTVLYQGGSYEITTFRTESEYQDFRRPSRVTFVQSLSEDLKRRDFTINALAMNAQGEIIDLFGGLDDLKNNLLKAVGDPNKRFSEDALRMMRAVRFVSQLEFNLARNTQEAITKNHELLKKISIERIRDEFVKLGIGRNARQAFNVFLETGLYNDVPEFIDKRDALEVFPKLNFVPISEVNFWSTIIIILNIQNKQISKFMHAWKNSNATSAAVEKVVCLFDLLSEHSPTDYELFVAGKATLQNAIAVARSLGQTIESQTLIDRYAALPIKTSAELSIDGHFLMEKGIAAGPQLGKILTTIKENIIGGKLENNPEAVSDFIDSKDI